jgi:hypothetical protein
VAGGGGILLLVGFEGVKREEEMGRRRFSGGCEGGMMALRFGSSRAEEGNSQQRWETSPWWAIPGRMAERSGPVSVGVKERRKWVERRNGPKVKEAAT